MFNQGLDVTVARNFGAKLDAMSRCLATEDSRATVCLSRGALAQLVRAPPCHGGGCGFEPRRLRKNLPLPFNLLKNRLRGFFNTLNPQQAARKVELVRKRLRIIQELAFLATRAVRFARRDEVERDWRRQLVGLPFRAPRSTHTRPVGLG